LETVGKIRSKPDVVGTFPAPHARYARIVAALSACRRLYGAMSEIQTPNEGFLNKEQLAEKLRCHPRTVENLMADGKIPYIKLGRKLVRFDWEKVKARLNQ
jgi:excisionase family DNA binding protein